MQVKMQIIIGSLALALSFNVHADDDIWSTSGPEGGRIMTIAIHPQDNQKIFVGTVENGIYKSTDAGSNWNHIDSEILDNTIRDIEIIPGPPDTIFAATVRGIYKSEDGGANWALVELPHETYNEILDIEIHPLYSNLIFVGGSFWNSNYRSSDGGRTWNDLNLPLVAVISIKTDPLRPDTIYLATQSADTGWTVFRSQNLGLDWEVIHNDLDSSLFANDLQIDHVNSSIIYIAGNDWDHPTGVGACIAKTTDCGNHWFDISPTNLDAPWIKSLTISPLDHNTIYACSERNGVFKSTDGGANWCQVNEGLRVRKAKRIVIDPASGVLYLGTYYDGIYKSTDEGSTWQKTSSSIFNADCEDIAVNPRNPDSIYIAARNGYFRSVDGTESWHQIDISFPFQPAGIYSIEIDPMNPNHIFTAIQYIQVENRSAFIRSFNGGASWDILEFPISGFCDVAISNLDSTRRLFVTAQGLYFSDDDGASWGPCDNGLPTNTYFFKVRASPHAPLSIYTWSYTQWLYRTTDRGGTWEQLSGPAGSGYIHEIQFDPVDAGIIYACRFNSGIFKSTDSGDSWIDITSNLPRFPNYFATSGLAVNPINPENLFVNSYHYGVFISDDGGGSWRAFNNGLNTLYAFASTVISPQDTNKIYVATDMQSVWSIHRTLTGVEEDEVSLPKDVRLSAYPNPFNPRTNISYALPQNGNIKIVIYNELGQRQAILFNGPQVTGEHSLTWDATPFPSGVYFVKLQNGKIEKTTKITLVK